MINGQRYEPIACLSLRHDFAVSVKHKAHFSYSVQNAKRSSTVPFSFSFRMHYVVLLINPFILLFIKNIHKDCYITAISPPSSIIFISFTRNREVRIIKNKMSRIDVIEARVIYKQRKGWRNTADWVGIK